MIREELDRTWAWGERHRRLAARLALAFSLTLIVDVLAAVLVWLFERDVDKTEVHTFGDALFFTTAQVLTVSSALRNPLTTAGRVVDLALEVWAVFVVTAIAGAFASFFLAGDR